jgi:hypothetical protein
MNAKDEICSLDMVAVDYYTLEDARWLINAVEELAINGSLDAVHELLCIANPQLSPDGLARIAGSLNTRLRRVLEEAR